MAAAARIGTMLLSPGFFAREVRMRSVVALALIVCAAACSKESGGKKAEPSAAPKEDPNLTGKGGDNPSSMPNKQVNCPTEVEGATTKIAWTDTDIQMTVTGDAEVLKEVGKRAKHLEEHQGLGGPKVEHSGRGTGGGGGKCPVVMKDTKIKVATAPDRVVIMVSPLTEQGFEALKAEVSRRQVAAGGPPPETAQLTGEAGWDGGIPGAAGADMTKERMEKLRKDEKKKKHK
jgi:hypothetical protein